MLATGVKLWKGAHSIQVAGKAYKAGPIPLTLLTKAAGANVNGDIYVYSRQQNVRYQQITGGNNKVLDVDVQFNVANGTIDVIVQLATDGAGASTSTGAQVANKVRSHAEARKYLKIASDGTGDGQTLATTITAVVHVVYLGIAHTTYDNAAGLADLPTDMTFFVARHQVASSAVNKPTLVGSYAALVDDNTCTSVVGPLDIALRIAEIENGNVFLDGNDIL